jgi:hypothetical protein
MTDMNQRYRLNEPAVMSETVDGEAIVVNLETGAYFSLRDTAAEVWDLLLSGQAPGAAADLLTARYGWAAAETLAAVETFVAALQADALIAAAAAPAADSDGVAVSGFAARPFSAPQLEKYTDMADLLLLDPIHDVDPQAGWPLRKPDQS